MDDIDRRILMALQREGRLTNNALATMVGLSPSPCLRRVRKLEEDGVITGYAALLDAAKAGKSLCVFVRVWLHGQDADSVEQFVGSVQGMPEILECHLMAGDCDFILRVATADLAAYRRFQAEKLSRIPCVQSVKTEIPMQIIKSTTVLPL